MPLIRKLLIATSILLCALGPSSGHAAGSTDPFAWPATTRVDHPWTRWWWLGSAVDKTNLTRQLTQFKEAGIGGVEICPIYGAKGYEDRFIDFLSPKWMEMYDHTVREAHRLGLGVDLTTGTGWPFGGPTVATNDASARVTTGHYDLSEGQSLKARLPRGRLQCLVAVSTNGASLDLTDQVRNGALDWIAPPGDWTLYAIALDGPVQQVKRSAPGGVGSVLDPFSVSALDRYLNRFDKAFVGHRDDLPRCFFHDSYEYYNADGTPDFFREFKKRRGYDVRTQLPALFGRGSEDTIARVKGDYRETLADLHLEYIKRWTAWAHSHGSLTRNQAHGGPANLLDTYAAADIPEMEIFRAYDETQMPMMKLAASTAHVQGKTLASSESFTWLTEHFNASLSQVKLAADFLFLSGINHIFFHGIPYSPAEAPWPGWQFYAAVNFGPQGGLWHDLPEFNAYVTRCESILQSGSPANDILLYVPFHDKWQTASGNLLMTFETSGRWMESEPFYKTAMTLWNRGYGFDEVSDRLLENARYRNGEIVMGGNPYRVLVLPKMKFIPEITLRNAIRLAREGATVLVEGELPTDVPGLAKLDQRRADLRRLLDSVEAAAGSNAPAQKVIGRGRFVYDAQIDAALNRLGVHREPCVDAGLRFIRRANSTGFIYFIVNRSDKPVDQWLSLGTHATSAVILDPRFSRSGLAMLRQNAGEESQVYLQLLPGDSCIVRTFTKRRITGPAWSYCERAGEPRTVSGTWNIQFVEGGPELPMTTDAQQLGSWTALDDPESKRFAGTARYSIEFDRPEGNADNWILDLGRVCESARVRVNGQDAGALWCAPFQIDIGRFLRPGRNKLEIEVTNLAANRIRDMDQRHVNWKYFYDANLASQRQRGVLDASEWPIRDSGLLGPVTLIPANHLAFR